MGPEGIDLDTRLAVTDNENFSSFQLLGGSFSEGAHTNANRFHDVDAMAPFSPRRTTQQRAQRQRREP